jgi:hypothetical protein
MLSKKKKTVFSLQFSGKVEFESSLQQEQKLTTGSYPEIDSMIILMYSERTS